MAVGKSRNDGASRYSRLSVDSVKAESAHWEDAEADALWRAVCAVTEAGDAIMFGKTRDGGALVVTLMSGDERIKQYAHTEEQVAKLLVDIRASIEDIG